MINKKFISISSDDYIINMDKVCSVDLIGTEIHFGFDSDDRSIPFPSSDDARRAYEKIKKQFMITEI